MEKNCPINHPPYYQSNGLEAIDVIEKFNLNFCRGAAVKYLLRAGKKEDELTDLRKAEWFVRREIQRLSASTVSVETEPSPTNGKACARIVAVSGPSRQPIACSQPDGVA